LSLDLGHPRLESRDAKFASARISISEFFKESRKQSKFAMTDREKNPATFESVKKRLQTSTVSQWTSFSAIGI
jgi:hypothetical protein